MPLPAYGLHMGVTYMQTWHKWRLLRLRHRVPPGRHHLPTPFWGGVVGIVLALVLIGYLESQMRPILESMATARVKNAVTTTLDDAITAQVTAAELSYGDLITIEKDENGRITALSSNITELNQLRSGILTTVVNAVDDMDRSHLSIPVGNLTGINFFSGRGFQLPVEVVSAGSTHAEFENQFSNAGINQTRHQIFLDVTVTVDILLPGDTLQADISAQVPVAETVIVGAVPDTYLQMGEIGDS